MIENSDMGNTKLFISNEMSEASYTPFKLETVRYVNIKDQFETLLKIENFESPMYRNTLINTARVLFSEAYVVMSSHEVEHFEEILGNLINIEKNIETLQKGSVMNYYKPGTDTQIRNIIKDYLDAMQHAAYGFLQELNKTMQIHGVGIKMNKKEDQIELLRKIFKAKNSFDNAFGIPISIELELFARLCVQRVQNKYDNLFICEGGTGDGKTNLTWAAAATIAQMNGNTFTVNDNFIFNEDKTYVDRLLRNAPHGFSLVFDEIGNQANAKTHWDIEQITLMNDWRLVRFVGLSIFGNWTSKDELDKQLRTRVNGIITIEERGKAQFRTYNKNRFTPNKEFVPYPVKNRVAYTSADANNIIEMFDELRHLTIPFYEVPAKMWAEYEEQKTLAKTMRRQSGRYFNKIQTAQEYYANFMMTLPPECVLITSDMLQQYSQKMGYSLSFRKLVENICRATGKKVKETFIWSQDPRDMWSGRINVDPVITGYILKLKSMYKGSEKAAT